MNPQPTAADRVFVLRNPDGSYREDWHALDSANCPGTRAREEQHPDADDYVLVDRSTLPPRMQGCAFCATHGPLTGKPVGPFWPQQLLLDRADRLNDLLQDTRLTGSRRSTAERRLKKIVGQAIREG
jgi:hypothetical protein